MKKEKNNEIDIKHARICKLLKSNKLDGLLLSRQSNFKWFCCGNLNDVIKNEDISLVYLFVSSTKRYLIATNSDASRVMEEELEGLGFELILYNWYDSTYNDVLKKLDVKNAGADFMCNNLKYMHTEISEIRAMLTEPEIKRYEKMCLEYRSILTDYCKCLKPNQTEKEVAAGLIAECAEKNIRLNVLMVGSDERISLYRHPCATDKKIKKYVLIATVAEREGICANVSRSIHFGSAPAGLLKKQDAVNQVRVIYQSFSVPGNTLGELIEIGKKAYADMGYPGEWQNHLQGGISGYAPLEFMALENSNIIINTNNVLSWNPTVRGAKSEDPILITSDGPAQFTIDINWPNKEYSSGTKSFECPLILEL